MMCFINIYRNSNNQPHPGNPENRRGECEVGSEGWTSRKAARAEERTFVGGQLEDRCLLKIKLAREARARSHRR